MLILTIIICIIFVLEIAIGSRPIAIHRKRKKLYFTLKYNNGYKEKFLIQINKNSNRIYRFPNTNNEVYLEVINNHIYINSTYREKLYAKKYIFENGTIKLKKIKPRFFLTFATSFIILSALCIGKYYIKTNIVPAYVSSTYKVHLIHDYDTYIDHNSYEGIHNYLIVGSDAREGMMTPHADVIILLSFNENTKKLNICSILRDIYVSMENKKALTIQDLDPSLPNYEVLKNTAADTKCFKSKLNYAVNLQHIDDNFKEHSVEEKYAEGLNSLVNCIEYNFRIPIKGVVNISWQEFIKFIDAMGGIDIEITEEMLITKIDNNHAYGITPVLDNQNSLYKTNDVFKSSGIQHLNGNKALAYTRLRYTVNGTNSDVERSQRIRHFTIEMMKQKGKELFTLAEPTKVSYISKGIYSSLSNNELYELVDIILSLPTPVDKNTLPYQYHNYVSNGVQYLAVNGKEEPRLDIQAKKLLCN